MIELRNVSKSFWTSKGPLVVADNINVTFPAGVSVGLLGRNGAGKSTLMEMIGGGARPDEGDVIRHGNVSWPVGFRGSFSGEMTGVQNTRFVARAYGVDTEELVYFVRHFSELGPQFQMPVRTYSSGMRSRLAFGISMGIPFDTYLIDEVTSVGDASFKQKSSAILKERLKTAGAIVVTHSIRQLRNLCDAGAVLENGQLTYFDRIKDAIDQHSENIGSREDE